jgi:hypothetical protein
VLNWRQVKRSNKRCQRTRNRQILCHQSIVDMPVQYNHCAQARFIISLQNSAAAQHRSPIAAAMTAVLALRAESVALE